MGLDMYLEGREYVIPDGWGEHDLKWKSVHDLGYWRKHYALDSFLRSHFKVDEHEMQLIYLDKKDIEQVVWAIEAGKCFAEEDYYGSNIKGRDLAILREARIWLGNKKHGILKTLSYRTSS